MFGGSVDKKIVRSSVREIAEFSLRKGSIEKGRTSVRLDDVFDGTKCHVEFQKKMTDEYGSERFKAEVFQRHETSNDEINLVITGRIDGVLHEDNSICIYEIKSVSRDLETIYENEYPVHWAQAECYAYMIPESKNKEIVIRIVYIERDSRKTRQFERIYSREQITSAFRELVDPYLEWMTGIRKWEILRNASIRAMEFPFSYYRLGQREMAEKSYLSIKDRTRLFVQAPTGIGKTMGAMFPAVKALGEGLVDRIFYLTAKNVTSLIAVENYRKLAENGLNLRTIVITAKDKVCPLEKRNCDPEFCERAKDYYDRLPVALKELLTNQFMDRDVVRGYADKYNICPFELSLDASLYSDMVIGDYNYLFDPRVRLQRFFEDIGEDYCFLVDEAHNLVDRSREMFSSMIEKKKVLELKRETKASWDDLKKRLETINKLMIALKKDIFNDERQEAYAALHDIPGNIVTAVRRCTVLMEFYLDHDMEEEYKEKFLELYFDFMFFSKISELYDDCYATFYEVHGNNLQVKLMCLDPSKILSKVMDKGRCSILFSATLSPQEYYKNTLGGRRIDRCMSLPSPFPRENLSVAVEGRISTKYRERHSSYYDIAKLLQDAFDKKTGNYIAFFPSYRYMQDVLQIYKELATDEELLVQKPGMDDSERELFLERFENHGSNTLVAFAVMGGIFGEGIDLAGEKLSGVVIIGTGLPTVCPERELIMNYYNEKNGSGFDYAYTFPGLNRVLQAAGRVIRSEYDKGFVILIDKRFGSYKYRDLFPEWWIPEYIFSSDEDVTDYIG